jgi:hypothetical protein
MFLFLHHPLVRYICSFCGAGFSALIKLARIQLYIFLFELPLLAAWGLPMSLGALLGNLVWGPCMVLFLGGSLCWTVAYFLGLPLAVPSWVLTNLADYWMSLLARWGSITWLCAVPPLPPLIVGVYGGSVLLTLYGRIRGLYGLRGELCLLLAIAGATIGGARMSVRYAVSVVAIPLAGKELFVCWYQDEVYVVDRRGALRNSMSLESWGTFSVRPILVQRFGVLCSVMVVVMLPTAARLEGALRLVRLGLCRTIGISERYRGMRWLRTWSARYEPELLVFLSPEHVTGLDACVETSFDKGEKGCNTELCSRSFRGFQ